MANWKRLALGGALLFVATATVVPFVSRGTRSVRRLFESSHSASTRFDRKQSAALFVGVREFTSASIEKVPYAVDDAVDLAYTFAIHRRVSLVPPRNVVLLLAGKSPVKPESREHLRVLREAGADIRFRADIAEVRAALREQTELAGRDGLLIVSLATHGLLRDGNGYLLGASSVVHDPDTMLPLADVFETIALSPAQRSLVFVDACRERMTAGTRSVLASAMTGAPPLVRRMGRTRGQAVFFAAAAGGVAYDDPEARNGVFTKTVISGLNCGAAKVRNAVTVDTLAFYVERNVSKWIRENRDPSIGSATHSDMDGEARSMPLAQCWVAAGFGPSRVTAEGSTVQAFSDKNEPLWQHDAGGPVIHVEAADLDADGRREVVLATRGAITALDDEGKSLWSAHESMTLTAFATGDLFRQHTNEVVAIWNDENSPASLLAIYAPDGTRLGAFNDDGHLDHVRILRPTNRHVPRIVVTSGNTVLLFDPKKLAGGKPLWSGTISPHTDPIASLDILDADGDSKNDIALTTESGARIALDFTGHPIGARSSAHFEPIAPKRSRR